MKYYKEIYKMNCYRPNLAAQSVGYVDKIEIVECLLEEAHFFELFYSGKLFRVEIVDNELALYSYRPNIGIICRKFVPRFVKLWEKGEPMWIREKLFSLINNTPITRCYIDKPKSYEVISSSIVDICPCSNKETEAVLSALETSMIPQVRTSVIYERGNKFHNKIIKRII